MKINFKAALNTVLRTCDARKPEIATGVGIVLMVASTVGAVCATIKTMRKVSDIKEEKLLNIMDEAGVESYDDLSEEEKEAYNDILDNPIPVKEVVKTCGKYWIAPIVAEGTGIFCSIFSNRESAKRLSIATSALAYQIAEAKDYKEAAKDILGQEKEEEIEKAQTFKTAKRRMVREEDVIDTGTGDQYYEEYYTGALLKAGPEYIDACLNELNELILNKKEYAIKDDLAYKYDTSLVYVTISEWCNILSLKIKTTPLTDQFGFDARNGQARFAASNSNLRMLDNNRSCIVIRFDRCNRPDYINP